MTRRADRVRDDADDTAPARRSRSRSAMARLAGGLAAMGAVGGLAFVAGFVVFAIYVTDVREPDPEPTDGIVVLTGGRDRVNAAVDLLAAGKAKRLLISGVHHKTTAGDLARATSQRQALFACCVDLGRRAINTAGNAIETRDWVTRHGMRSLLVVTNAYHIPRSMAEMRALMPGIVLVAYPVRPADLPLDGWLRDPQSARLLMSEYVKYIVAVTRLGLGIEGPTSPRTTTADITGGT